nr:hypothetical protein [uncultured Dorea sp.]
MRKRKRQNGGQKNDSQEVQMMRQNAGQKLQLRYTDQNGRQEEQQIKKIKKLKRIDLLEILLAQSKRIDELEEELAETKHQLASKRIKIREIGTLAEASLQLNQIFEDADAAARQYLHNIRRLNRMAERKYQKEKMQQIPKEKMQQIPKEKMQQMPKDQMQQISKEKICKKQTLKKGSGQERVNRHEENQVEFRSVTNDSVSGQPSETGKI